MKIITQETFDQVVLENINDFDYPLEEAICETVKEFETQGVELSNIVQNLRVAEDNSAIIHDVIEALDKIKCPNCTIEEYYVALKAFTIQCRMSLAHRVLANKYQAYDVLIGTLKKSKDHPELIGRILQSITALTVTNSDILNEEGISVMAEFLSNFHQWSSDARAMEYLARWCMECCLKHENNRQTLFEAEIPGKLINLLQANRSQGRVVIATIKSLRAFTLDDDIRLAYGKAHDHARILVEEHNLIKICLSLIDDYPENVDVTSELLSTVSQLCVRAEYCQLAVDNGALSVVNNILVSFPDDAKLNKQAINLLKIVSGNDKVKDEAMKTGSSQLVICSLVKHQLSVGVSEAALGAISMLALRSNNNAKSLIQEGAADAVVQAMKIHPAEIRIQKIGCMAVRNLAARLPENRAALIECQVEAVIHAAMNTFKDGIKDMAKAALRDLDLNVHLEEQWKGTGKNLEQ